MFKRLLVVLMLLALFALDANATDYSFVKGGAYGQLGTSTPLTTFFYARADENLAVISDKTGLVCVLKGFSYGQEAYLQENSSYRAPYDDLYMLVCLRRYGYGNAIVGVITIP